MERCPDRACVKQDLIIVAGFEVKPIRKNSDKKNCFSAWNAHCRLAMNPNMDKRESHWRYVYPGRVKKKTVL